MKAWKNITLDLPGMDLRQVSEQLSILNVASILIKDNRSELESDWFDDPENPALLTGDTHSIALLMESGKSVTELLAEIQRILNIDKTPDYTEEYIEDVDWVAYTQTLFKEIKISDSFRVVPPWEAEKKFNGKTIVIEPGRAFGTGSHPTTQLCLRWLETNLSIGDSLLDYGCGSGILSIEELYKISPKHMRKLWGSVQGERFWYMLRGVEIPIDTSQRRTIGHSHVLEPKFRQVDLAQQVMSRLLLKAASRLRRLQYYANNLSISFRTENGLKMQGTKKFYRACDNITLLNEGTKIWNDLIKKNQIRSVKKISVTLFNLKKKAELQPNLFATIHQQHLTEKFESLSEAMDTINSRFGRDSIALGNIPNQIQSFSGTRIAFTRIPDKKEFNE